MGGSSSKVARTLPKLERTELPSWAGARTPSSVHQQAAAVSKNKGQVLSASQSPSRHDMDQAIEQDARDPHLLSNLSRLSPVRVDNLMHAIQPATNRTQHLHDSQRQSESEASSSYGTRNRLLASSLSCLLDERKSTSDTELETLAAKYDLDVQKLNSITRFVNSPSTEERSMRKDFTENERVTMNAMWVGPPSHIQSTRRLTES